MCPWCRVDVDRITVGGVRCEGLQRLIGAVKFQYARAGVKELVGIVADQVPEGATIVPIPTSVAHIRVWGYDHMELLAAQLARHSGVRVCSLLHSTSHHTQHRLNRAERLQAAGAAFELARAVDLSARYIVFDDIITTGATMRAAVQILRQAGARHIEVLALARQPSTNRPVSVKMGNIAWRDDRVV